MKKISQKGYTCGQEEVMSMLELYKPQTKTMLIKMAHELRDRSIRTYPNSFKPTLWGYGYRLGVCDGLLNYENDHLKKNVNKLNESKMD
jgi:hypothetical protein